MTLSMISAAPSVALTGTLPVEVFRNRAPPSIASSDAARISSSDCSTPVSRMAFTGAPSAEAQTRMTLATTFSGRPSISAR